MVVLLLPLLLLLLPSPPPVVKVRVAVAVAVAVASQAASAARTQKARSGEQHAVELLALPGGALLQSMKEQKHIFSTVSPYEWVSHSR